MNHLAKSTILGLYKYSGAMAAQERVRYWRGHAFLPILLCHRVTDAIPPDGLTVSTAWFRGLCRLLQNRFHVISLTEAMQFITSGTRPPRRTVAITFDDCYYDNLPAARVLAEHKLPACFFIPTAYPGTNHVFTWDKGLTEMANLSWENIRELVELGHEVGSHTIHHVDMAQVEMEEARAELEGSKKVLEGHLGKPVRWFAYPFGSRANFRTEVLDLVYNAGYEGCFSGYGGFAPIGVNRQIIPRVPVPSFRSLLNLEMHLSGCLSWLYALKRKAGMIE